MNDITNRHFISHLFPSLLLAGNFCPGGIEKSCLRHKYSFLLALTARRNCKKSAKFSIMWSKKVLYHFLHSDHIQTKKNIYLIIKKIATNIAIYMELFVERWSLVTSKRCDCVINCYFLMRYHLD